jgi:hypothetical protein
VRVAVKRFRLGRAENRVGKEEKRILRRDIKELY